MLSDHSIGLIHQDLGRQTNLGHKVKIVPNFLTIDRRKQQLSSSFKVLYQFQFCNQKFADQSLLLVRRNIGRIKLIKRMDLLSKIRSHLSTYNKDLKFYQSRILFGIQAQVVRSHYPELFHLDSTSIYQ